MAVREFERARQFLVGRFRGANDGWHSGSIERNRPRLHDLHSLNRDYHHHR